MSRDDAIIALLTARDAGAMPHAGVRSLLEHLIGTAELLGRWGQPDAIRHAALIHSVYGTEVYRRAIAGERDRADARRSGCRRACALAAGRPGQEPPPET